MSDNEDKTTPLSLTMTVLGSGSYRLTDMTHGGAAYFEDTGTLRFAGVEHWERYEPMLRGKRLMDLEGDVWAYVDGQWRYWVKGWLSVHYFVKGGWCSDTPIEDYVEDGFTIVGDFD